MEKYTATDDREVVVGQAHIRRSCPLERIKRNPKKHPVECVFTLHKAYTPNGFIMLEFIVASPYQMDSEC